MQINADWAPPCLAVSPLMHCASVVDHNAPAVPLNFWNIRRQHGDHSAACARDLSIIQAHPLHLSPLPSVAPLPIFPRRSIVCSGTNYYSVPPVDVTTKRSQGVYSPGCLDSASPRGKYRHAGGGDCTTRIQACVVKRCAWLFMTEGADKVGGITGRTEIWCQLCTHRDSTKAIKTAKNKFKFVIYSKTNKNKRNDWLISSSNKNKHKNI